MPRTTVPVTTVPGPNPTAGVAITETAADITNFNQVAATGKEILMFRNSGASPYTITITSAPDPYGRIKDIAAESIAAGAIRVVAPTELLAWRQTDGMLYFQASNAAVMITVLRWP